MHARSTIAAVVLLLVLSLAAAMSPRASSTSSHLRPAERCAGAITVVDATHDTRSWLIPPSPPYSVPRYGDLRAFDLKATSAGVCVRWTTAAPAPSGTHFVFVAWGPFVRQGGAAVASSYGFDLELRKDGALATYGLARVGSNALHVIHVRAGQTGSVVSVFVPMAELNPPPANMPSRPPFPYRAFAFQMRVLTAPDSRHNQQVDFWPQEEHQLKTAADVNGRLCVPCRDTRFVP